MKPRTVALLALVGLVAMSLLKGYLHIDDATTVLISTISGAVVGFYFGAQPSNTPPSIPP